MCVGVSSCDVTLCVGVSSCDVTLTHAISYCITCYLAYFTGEQVVILYAKRLICIQLSMLASSTCCTGVLRRSAFSSLLPADQLTLKGNMM